MTRHAMQSACKMQCKVHAGWTAKCNAKAKQVQCRVRVRVRVTPTGVCRNGYFCFPVVDFLHCMKVPNAGASRLPGRVHAMPGENFGSIS